MADNDSPPRARRWRKGYEEIVVAAVLLLGAIFFRVRIESFVRGRDGTNLNPDFWPGTLLSIAIVLSAIYLVLAVVWSRREAAAEAEAHAAVPARTPSAGADPADAGGTSAGASAVTTAAPEVVEHPEAHTGSVYKLLGGFLLLGAYIYLLDPLGFIPASLLFSVAFMMLVGERRWYVLLIFPVVAVAVLLGIFTQLLVVALPRGSGIFVDLSTYFY